MKLKFKANNYQSILSLSMPDNRLGHIMTPSSNSSILKIIHLTIIIILYIIRKQLIHGAKQMFKLGAILIGSKTSTVTNFSCEIQFDFWCFY